MHPEPSEHEGDLFMPDEQTNPLSRREMWLTIALAIARDGLPEPKSFELYTGPSPFLCLSFDSHAAADAWARWLGLSEFKDKTFDHYTPPRIRRQYGWHDRDGWSWQIEGFEQGVSPLAEQVAAAILTPDAPSLPIELVAA